MSASKHTPGPWTYDGPPDDIIVWSGPESRICFMTSDGPAEANARLIAAAPELLEALKGIVSDFDAVTTCTKSKYQSPNGICAYDNALSAIAKAEGRQP